jgi:DNA polymerase
MVVDFETRSFADLKKCGAWRYAADPSTEVLCLTYEVHGGAATWTPGHPFPDPIRECVNNGGWLVAHNAGFEKAIWRHVMVPVHGWPDVPDTQWEDTLATAAYKNLPKSLDDVTRILDLPRLKDTAGSKLTIGLSKMKDGYLPKITPNILARVVAYCENDVWSQRAVLDRLGSLPETERQVWLLDQRINQRGFRIDVPLVRAMQKIVDGAVTPMAEEFKALTGLKFTQTVALVGWCAENGFAIPNMTAETVTKALGASPDLGDDDIEDAPAALPANVRRALEIRQLIGSAAVKKIGVAQACVMDDGRVRGTLQYHGAAPGRWAGRLLQPHNFPRGTIAGDIDAKVAAIMSGDPERVSEFGPPVETVVSSLRHMIVADPGSQLVAGDFSGIEARLILAFSGQYDKHSLMASGADVYADMASAIYGRLIDPATDLVERQTGKNSVLGLGFGMGAAKFLLKYGAGQDLEFCNHVVQTYRRDWAPKVPTLWRGIMDAATRVVQDGNGEDFRGLRFELEGGFLSMRLHSGRKIWYYDPQPCLETVPWDTTPRPGFTFLAKKFGKFVRVKAFGGLLAQNWTEAAARDLLTAAMFRCEREGLPVILTVHDEIVVEARKGHSGPDTLREIMLDKPPWAREIGLEIDAKCWSGERYRK